MHFSFFLMAMKIEFSDFIHLSFLGNQETIENSNFSETTTTNNCDCTKRSDAMRNVSSNSGNNFHLIRMEKRPICTRLYSIVSRAHCLDQNKNYKIKRSLRLFLFCFFLFNLIPCVFLHRNALSSFQQQL